METGQSGSFRAAHHSELGSLAQAASRQHPPVPAAPGSAARALPSAGVRVRLCREPSLGVEVTPPPTPAPGGPAPLSAGLLRGHGGTSPHLRTTHCAARLRLTSGSGRTKGHLAVRVRRCPSATGSGQCTRPDPGPRLWPARRASAVALWPASPPDASTSRRSGLLRRRMRPLSRRSGAPGRARPGGHSRGDPVRRPSDEAPGPDGSPRRLQPRARALAVPRSPASSTPERRAAQSLSADDHLTKSFLYRRKRGNAAPAERRS